MEARRPPHGLDKTMRAISFLFHDVVPDGRLEVSGFQGAGADIYKLDCESFRAHLSAIRSALRGQVVTATDLLAAESQQTPPILLTFDDGGESALLYTADMLEQQGWRGHFFVTAGRIGTLGFLDAVQIRELRNRGHVIGSHSYSHPTRMSRCSPPELDEEWRRSGEVLAEVLSEPVRIASVPGGFYSREVAASAARAGIELLFNSEPVTGSATVDGCVVLGRFGAQRSTPPSWSAEVVGPGGSRRFREYAFWNAKKAGKKALGPVWLAARRMLLQLRR